MRWFVVCATAVLVLWTVHTASPYWALLDLARAVESRDAERVARRVNARAVRVALTKQLAAEVLESRPAASTLGGADPGLTAGGIATLADPLLEKYLTPEGLIGLLEDLSPADAQPVRLAGHLRLDARSLREAATLVWGSRWRGFRNLSFRVPPEGSASAQARLHFRLSRLTWRLVAIDLTPETRRRLVDEILRVIAERSRR